MAHILRGRRRRIQRAAVADQQLAEIVALRLAQRVENLVELHRGRRVRDRDVVSGIELGRAGAARIEVDEEVALEEDAGPDGREGVLANRSALVLDREGDLRRVALRLDLEHLADVDAGNADRRLVADLHAVLERRGQRVAVTSEGDVLREGEEGPDDDEHNQDQADLLVGEPALGRARPCFSFVGSSHQLFLPFFFFFFFFFLGGTV
jgi:hypothetical protein